MLNVFKIAVRNLLRYRRRTLLTSILITIGIVSALLFIAASGSFKALIVGQITDSMLGHIQVHRKGYVASLDNLPLNRNMKPKMVEKVKEALDQNENVESWSPRVKFGAMFSNFTETTSIRLNGIIPEKEVVTVPLLPGRLLDNTLTDEPFVSRGQIVIPELLAKGMKVSKGDTIVLVATNEDGSVNGKTFMVRGIIESLMGPGGRDGYLHIDDARELLRIPDRQISEIVVRLRDLSKLEDVHTELNASLGSINSKQGKPMLEVHTWKELAPFSKVAQMIDLFTLFVKIMLISIVLVSIMNVMIMAVYERIREIGTIAAIGTKPGTILALFVTEGFLLGITGAAIGSVVSLLSVAVLNMAKITYSFGRLDNLVLEPSLQACDVVSVCAVVIVAAVLASLQPAWKASRMDPITALRHV
jgi:putative ABC transport system permease protein